MTQAPESSGTIGFLTAPELLRDLFLRKATGQLVAYRGETVKKVFLRSGSVLYATSNLPADRLGDVLLANGMITREQYEEAASQVVATGRKQGTVLVQIGALTPKDLFRGLIAQVREQVVSLFAWDEGHWRYFEGLPPREEIVSLRLNPGSLIMEGLARTAADARWAGVWDPARRLRLVENPPLSAEELGDAGGVERLLAFVGEGRPTEEMARQLGRDPREIAAMLHGLKLLGLIEALPAPAAEAPSPAAAAAVEAAAPADEAARLLRAKIAALAGKLDSLSHYQLLGLTPQSDRGAIKRAYIALAKEYHPDHFFRQEFEDLQEPANTIFMRINEAYTTLHNPTARAEYDREVLRLNAQPARVKEPSGDSHLAQEQYAKGVAALNAGDAWTAIQALRWAVNLAPQNPRYHTWLGLALLRTRKRLHEAEEHCKTAIALDYNNAQYYVHLGQVYRAGRLYEKARQQFETALKLDPKHAEALKELRELESGSAHEKSILDRILNK